VVTIDTTVWVDYFRGVPNRETDWLDAELDRQRLALIDIILCEVLRAFHYDSAAAAAAERRLRKLEIFETGGVELATEAARNYRVLRARGHTMRKTIDCLIASFCIRSGHSLLHRNRNFEPFERYLELSVAHV
jgi:predicted nucleic acid-binding protein